jgi:hypothetical protein
VSDEVIARTAELGKDATPVGAVVLSGLDDVTASAIVSGAVVIVNNMRYVPFRQVYRHPVHGWKVLLAPKKDD